MTLYKEKESQKEVINGMIENEEKYLLEINKLKSIIKDVREYMEKTIQDDGEYLGYKSMYTEDYYKLLEILDKENKND